MILENVFLSHTQYLQEDFLKLIYSINTKSTISIDGNWGTGKTFFVNFEGEKLTIEVLYKFRRLLDNMDNQGTSGIDIYILTENEKEKLRF